jgi:hypothetical protein
LAFETPTEYLEYYHKIYGNYRVQLLLMKRAYNWINYGTKEYEEYLKEINPNTPNNRERMLDEVVFDVESPKLKTDIFDKKKKRIKETYEEISKRMKKDYNLSFSGWWSGGEGVHIHSFFPELKKFSKYDRGIIKGLLLKKICYGFLTHDKEGKKGKIDLQKTPFIQLECAKHRKGGVKTLIEEHYVGTNKIPEEVMKDFYKIKIEYRKKKPVEFKKNSMPSCIKYLRYEDFRNLEDGRQRACFVLAAYYANYTNLNKGEVFDELKKWNFDSCRGSLTDSYIKSQINMTFNHQKNGGKKMGCGFIKQLLIDVGISGLCVGCDINNERNKK